MNKSIAALALLLGPVAAALASEPASQDVAVSTVAGSSMVVEWTGTALPGGSGLGSAGGIVDPATAVGCQMGPDDSHDIVLTVPAGAYDSVDVIADFHIEWDQGTPPPGGLVGDPDLALTVYRGSTEIASSDGGAPEENVRVINPEAATFGVVVCPFTASQPTDYRASLTLSTKAKAMCLMAPTKALAHSTLLSAGSGAKDDESYFELPNFDRYRQEARTQASAVPNDLQGRYQSAQFDRSMGLPTFLWAKTDAPVASVGALTARELLIERARAHLASEAKKLKLTSAMISEAKVFDAQYNGKGPAVVRLRQTVNGLEVYHRSLNVLLDRSNKPVAVSGYFATDYNPADISGLRFAHSAPEAIAAAWGNLGGAVSGSAFTRTGSKAGYEIYSSPVLSGNYVLERAPRAKAIYYPRKGGLVPAYQVELVARPKSGRGGFLAYALVVSAADNSVLNRETLSAQATPFSYRVFADVDGIKQPYDEPTGNGYIPYIGATPEQQPEMLGAPSNLVTLVSGPISTGDPWLADNATVTTGNHVDACIDTYDVMGVPIAVPPPVNACLQGLEPRTPTTAANTFDYPIAAYDDPSTASAKNGAVVSMFYVINWLHDWWYDHGFNEESGNAQTSNYDRGGEEGDPLLAQGQDGSGRNNANMATPADGSSPVMQQYLFNGSINGKVEVTAPALGEIAFNGVEYGPQTFDYTGTAIVPDDMFDPTDDGCTGLTTPASPVTPPIVGSPVVAIPVPQPDPAMMGKIAVIVRGGGCPGSFKVRWAVQSGAAAVVLVHNADGPPPYLVNGDVPIDAPVQPTNMVYQIPIVTIRQDDGQRIKDAIAAGETVTMHLVRQPTIDLDGTLDNLIIGHEYFHYVHNRLADPGNNQARSMGEGWGDINAFMMSARPEDRLVPGNDKYQGAYAGATYVVQNSFFGIRRAPYSTSFANNGFTLKHIADGEPTPDGGDGAINSEVHNSGEIWANMMWECYVGLLNQPRHSFGEAQSRMKDYIIGGFKMTPADATYTEARDAVLSVVLAADYLDYEACSNGFARRGAGLNAISPERDSADHVGVVEDFAPFVCKATTVPPVPGTPPVITPGPVPPGSSAGSVGSGRFGGGAMNLLLLLPLISMSLLRRRRRLGS